MSDLYPTGQMDPVHPDGARQGGPRPRHLPPRRQRPAPRHVAPASASSARPAARSGTTIVTDWDGERVYFECRERHVEWATGCGASGWISPFGGAAKLPWNLEWAAQWSLFGVTIEPNGKDLATAGGSRDRSDAIAREVFEREPPLNVPYEFLNIGGKKMSTSKGRGAAAHQIAEVVPPEQLRFLFLRPRPEPGHRLRPERHRRDPAPVRRVRPVRGGDGRTRGEGRHPAGLRCDVPLLAARPGRRLGRRGGRVPTGVRAPRAARCRSPAWTSPSASPRRRGVP